MATLVHPPTQKMCTKRDGGGGSDTHLLPVDGFAVMTFTVLTREQV